jgi:accessory gene regulator B
MIEYTARRISEKISKASTTNVSVDVMAYALGFYLNFFGVILLTAAAGATLGCFKEAMIAMGAFGVLRICSGGAHMKSLTACTVVSAAIFCAIPFIPMSDHATLAITATSVVIVAIKSPSFRHKPNMGGRKKMFYRTVSVAMVAANLLFGSAAFALACLAQGVTLFRLREGGEHS